LVGLFFMFRRFLRAIVAAWKSDQAFRILLALVISLLVSGTTFFTLVEGWSVLDSLYFSVTTLTTVGFGEPAPATALGKIFTMLYIFVGLGVIGGFINVLAKHTFARKMRRAGVSEDQQEGEGEAKEGEGEAKEDAPGS
jgi:voltage-gated potassium channel Kch